MMRIDAHQHFWNPERGDYGWLTPDLGPLYRVYGPADLAPLLANARMDGTILVQAAPSVAETDYLLAIAAETPFVKGVVGWIDFERPDQRSTLLRLASNPALVGLRPTIQDLPDPDWMLRADVQWAFDALIEHGLAFDALLYPVHLDRFLRLMERHPDLRAVVDHGAKPVIRERQFDAWARDMALVAKETPAFCKLSGLVTEAGPQWGEADLKPYIDHLIESFGPDRLIFGSDWPVLTLASDYARWVTLAETFTARLGRDAQAKIFGGNAMRFYAIKT